MTSQEILERAEMIDPPRSNAVIMREIAALSDDLHSLVTDYRDIQRCDYDAGEDGSDDFHADRESVWDEILGELDELAHSDEEE